ncbi:polymer-forming cytoskeletal protein [Halorientalis sp.]|uniref:polymer-forming cytoskeletal protein n=1 Tax=Halorientalis sp. TaxID=1931229 RepID=UPI002616FB2B|nr:polymer-forming cytoskeletal protein [Halorientalis sp.]
MPLRSDLLDELQIPDGTTVEEHDLVTDGDVIVGGQSTVEFGVRGHNVIAGERVRFGGDIEAEGDCRLDMWSDVAGNVLVGENAYIGERVHVGGQLMVSGDLDIGDDVDIEEGFEASGWIVIRNPMPTIVFLFVYLSHLLRIGEEETANEVASEVLGEDSADCDPVLIPRNGSVSDDAWRVSTPATVGDDCRLHGNLRAERLAVGEDTVVFGSLRARSDIHVGTGTEIKGDVTTRDGTVSVGPGVTVWGDISATDVQLHDDATVEGSIRARGEVTMLQSDSGTGAPEADDSAEEAEETGDSAVQSGDDDTAEDTERVTVPEEGDADVERVTAEDPEGERVTVPEDGSDTDDDYRENGHEAGLAE